jgi:hypothetical protein
MATMAVVKPAIPAKSAARGAARKPKSEPPTYATYAQAIRGRTAPELLPENRYAASTAASHHLPARVALYAGV